MSLNGDFWVPSRKWQLINWFRQHNPQWSISNLSHYQLLAIYIKEREKWSHGQGQTGMSNQSQIIHMST